MAMQMGCSWCCGRPAFDLLPPGELKIVMMQHEDSHNDLVRRCEVVRPLGLDQEKIRSNFWIETVRGKIGEAAIEIMRDLVIWRKADLLIVNPISAYHDGDISQNKDNVKFLYGELGELLAELRIGMFAFHHKGKPPKGQQGKNHSEDIYFQVMYDILGGSVLTNFFRGIITVSPLGNSDIFRFTLAKRFEESGWPTKIQQFKWHEDKAKRLWVPASVAEADGAKKASWKGLDDLRELVSVTDTIAREVLENAAANSGFRQRKYRALIAEACADSTPPNLRLYVWTLYNPNGAPKIAYSRYEQPADQTAQAIKEAKKARKIQSSSTMTTTK
jgi:hypothetical protein